MCVGEWSRRNLLDIDDLKSAANAPDLDGDEEYAMEDGWERVRASQ